MIRDYYSLKPYIRKQTFSERFKRKKMNSDEIVAVILDAPSILRKEYTMNLVKSIIKHKNLSLFVCEKGFEQSSTFSIKNKSKR